MDLAACVYLFEAHSSHRFLFGVVKKFCSFGIWSNTQCITSVDALHTTRSPTPPPSPCYTLCRLCRPYSHREGGGGVNWREGRGR
jgi:hypothetical protein